MPRRRPQRWCRTWRSVLCRPLKDPRGHTAGQGLRLGANDSEEFGLRGSDALRAKFQGVRDFHQRLPQGSNDIVFSSCSGAVRIFGADELIATPAALIGTPTLISTASPAGEKAAVLDLCMSLSVRFCAERPEVAGSSACAATCRSARWNRWSYSRSNTAWLSPPPPPLLLN